MVEIYLNLPGKKSRHTTLFALLGKKQNVKLPTAACHLLPFRSQTSHQLPPLLQSQTPFVSPSISLCYLCSLLSLIYCPLWNTGRVKCKLADQGKQQKTEVLLSFKSSKQPSVTVRCPCGEIVR